MNTQHPKAVEAAQRANERHAQREEIRAVIAKAQSRGCRFLTVGPYTLCYVVDRRDLMQVSTAILHPTDRYDKLSGQAVALSRFLAKECILLKKPSGVDAKTFLRTAFAILTMSPNVFKMNTLTAGLMK